MPEAGADPVVGGDTRAWSTVPIRYFSTSSSMIPCAVWSVPAIGWESARARQEEVDREQVLQLAKRLAVQRERQRSEDLVQIEDMKRALRER